MGTCTSGIVSYTVRTIDLAGQYIQHDAGILNGNSGGPLFDLNGRLIGINTMKRRGTDIVGFAIPIEQALDVATDIVRYGHRRRPYLGALLEDRQHGDMPAVVVTEVVDRSPAWQAGLRVGDVVVSVGRDHMRVHRVSEFLDSMRRLVPGMRWPIDVRRGTTSVALAVQPTIRER
jgi:S1-C subfamily serine protease